jgi:putative oxidoreductase
MRKIFAQLEPLTFALFRIVFGFLFLQFGTQKLFGWPNTPAGYTPTIFMKVAACIELTCGFLIMIGLVTEFAAFLASGEMDSSIFWFTSRSDSGRSSGAVFQQYSYVSRSSL